LAFIQINVRERSQVAQNVRVRSVEPEFPKDAPRRLASIDSKGSGLGLVELGSLGHRNQRHREGEAASALVASHEIPAGGSVSPLIAVADLKRAPVSLA